MSPNQKLAVLAKRAAWLGKRIAEAESAKPSKDLSYDKAELAALDWAIEKLSEAA